MKRELTLTHDPITETAPQMSEGMGAVVTFHGVVRGTEEGEAIAAIDYDANEEMPRIEGSGDWENGKVDDAQHREHTSKS